MTKKQLYFNDFRGFLAKTLFFPNGVHLGPFLGPVFCKKYSDYTACLMIFVDFGQKVVPKMDPNALHSEKTRLGPLLGPGFCKKYSDYSTFLTFLKSASLRSKCPKRSQNGRSGASWAEAGGFMVFYKKS